MRRHRKPTFFSIYPETPSQKAGGEHSTINGHRLMRHLINLTNEGWERTFQVVSQLTMVVTATRTYPACANFLFEHTLSTDAEFARLIKDSTDLRSLLLAYPSEGKIARIMTKMSQTRHFGLEEADYTLLQQTADELRDRHGLAPISIRPINAFIDSMKAETFSDDSSRSSSLS